MARRTSLLTHSSQNQAKELLRLCLTPASEFPNITSHLPHSHPQLPHQTSRPVTSLTHARKPLKLDTLFFILNKSYHKIRSLPDIQLKTFIPAPPLAVPSLLEVSNSPITRLSAREDFEVNERTIELNTKLSELLLQLRHELPRFFEESQSFSIYSKDLKFVFRYSPFSLKLSSIFQYKMFLSSFRSLFKLFYSDLRVELLKMTKSQSDYSISTRWRVSGLYRLSRSNRSVFDGISTFYMDEKGQVNCHTVERVSKNKRKVPPLAWFFIAVGYYYPSELKDANSNAVEFAKRKKQSEKNLKHNSQL